MKKRIEIFAYRLQLADAVKKKVRQGTVQVDCTAAPIDGEKNENYVRLVELRPGEKIIGSAR